MNSATKKAMEDDSRLTAIVNELRQKGHLPALDANVDTICTLTADPLTSTADLTSVILRDCALTSSVITTANSALYRPSEPIKTVSTALLLMGFEKVRSLALGLGIVKQISQCAKSRTLYRFFACSYFSGLFAMALGKRTGHENPEELLVAGVLTALPRLLLANAYPERFAAMESRVMKERQSINAACLEVFGVTYEGLTAEIAAYWRMPANVAQCLRSRGKGDSAVHLVRQAGQVSDLLFGNVPGGAEALSQIEKDLQNSLKNTDFRLSDFIETSCAADQNVARFFHLSAKDVEMMVKIAEWGKVNPAEVANSLAFGAAAKELEQAQEDPAQVMSHYLTDLALGLCRGSDINRILLTALEAVYRCLRPACVLAAFLNGPKTILEGRFYLGPSTLVMAADFSVDLKDERSPIVRSLRQARILAASVREELPLPFLLKLKLNGVLMAPIVVNGTAIGLCLVGREGMGLWSEQETLWIEAIAGQIALAFERAGAKNR
jgi:HD-like signal output (HDOD) protein